MRDSKPACMMIRPWLKENLGKTCLGVLTGTDSRALDAAVQILELINLEEGQTLIDAFGAVVRRMQPTARHLAYHAIAMAMNWSDRSRIWNAAGLEDCRPGRCAHEPKGGQS